MYTNTKLNIVFLSKCVLYAYVCMYVYMHI